MDVKFITLLTAYTICLAIPGLGKYQGFHWKTPSWQTGEETLIIQLTCPLTESSLEDTKLFVVLCTTLVWFGLIILFPSSIAKKADDLGFDLLLMKTPIKHGEIWVHACRHLPVRTATTSSVTLSSCLFPPAHTHSVFLKSTHRHVSFGQFIAEECAHFRQLLWCWNTVKV